MNFACIGVCPGELLLPSSSIQEETWACVACDQYTSQPEYWEEAARIVGDAPSCLKLVLPECYLNEAAQRVPQIHREMERYVADGVLDMSADAGMMLLERTTQSGSRLGLVCLADLESYDFTGRKSLIRPTEETITSRLPPRQAVRREALLESAHVMLLIDDPQDTVIGPLYRRWQGAMDAYDFEAMQGCGHLRGKRITSDEELAAVCHALAALMEKQGEEPLLFAVGDGNHSLATAKAHWEELKARLSPEAQRTHPARYAMVEVVNIHDDALKFEPIHRVLMHVDADEMVKDWAEYCARRGMCLTLSPADGAERFTLLCGDEERDVYIAGASDPLPVATLQHYLDDFLRRHPEAEIDYIHGDDVLRRLSARPGCAGFLLPPLDKSAFFAAIDQLGTLPRKTFSMGHANEKRCYMECRRIR